MLKFRQFSYYHRYLQWLQKSHTLIAGNKYWKLVIWLLNYVIVFICAGCNGLFLYCPCCPIVKLLSESNNTLSAPKGDIFTYIILKTHIVLKVWFLKGNLFFVISVRIHLHFTVHIDKIFSIVLCTNSCTVDIWTLSSCLYLFISTSICYSLIFSNIFMSFILKASFW